MSKRPAPKKQPVYEESSSDEDEQPEQQQKPQVKAAAPKFPKPKGAAPKDPVNIVAMTWNSNIGQWESIVEGEVVYSRMPGKTSANAEPTPTKNVAAAAAVPVTAEVVDAPEEEEDEFVENLRKKQRKIMKAAKQQVAEIEQVIADHAEKEELKNRLAALEAAEKKFM